MKLKSSTIINASWLPLVTPGEVLLEEFMRPLGLNANSLSLKLHVPANRVSAILKGERTITAESALRLSRFFGNSALFWLNLQAQYDLAKASRDILPQIEREIPAGIH